MSTKYLLKIHPVLIQPMMKNKIYKVIMSKMIGVNKRFKPQMVIISKRRDHVNKIIITTLSQSKVAEMYLPVVCQRSQPLLQFCLPCGKGIIL